MVLHTLRAVEACSLIDDIVVVVPAERIGAMEELARRAGLSRIREIVPGGRERQDSVLAGLMRVGDPGIVVVHDGARPLVRPDVLADVTRRAADTGAASAGVPVRETVKAVEGDEALGTVSRESLWIAHTPQAFRTTLLQEAHRRAREDGFRGQDDAVLVERLGHRVRMVEDSPTNLKITVPEDLRLAEAYLTQTKTAIPTSRTGIGMDAHRFEMGRALRLGGVEIPAPRGLAGHSDADVLLHAIMDALLGGAGLGDIGTHFPPGDPAYKDMNSLVLLARVHKMLSADGWSVAHVDAVVLAEAPRLAPYIPEMCTRISRTLNIDGAVISIKATTTEGMGAIGRGEGIAAYAVATVSRID
jgi:2-C-methyl-D-erythritol 4-phosphate cytidylyltransferase/2-C-methyl-D-erythritol 2,4-cyclodiphosphate synthase